jgi:hypothetical protein
MSVVHPTVRMKPSKPYPEFPRLPEPFEVHTQTVWQLRLNYCVTLHVR